MSDARPECIAIGASTGGLHALSEFLRALPAETGAPILITQHLPALFMPFFARQMEAASGRVALVAEAGQQLVADRIYVAPGEAHLTVERGIDDVAVKLSRAAAASGNLPSVDPMLASVASAYGDRGVGVILSGMGKDGLLGAGRLIDAGGSILAQDRGSSAVWGMPRAVAEAGLACAMLPPAALARRVAAQIEAHPWN
jgi:two-component system chemotaxis response regulator CheB